ERPALSEVRDELRDRALLGLAVKMRQRLPHDRKPGAVVSALLASSSMWAPAVVSDAQFAARAAARVETPAPTPVARTVLRARIARVTAVCQAPHSGDVFVGFESGEVVCFRPSSGEVLPVTGEGALILSLATS